MPNNKSLFQKIAGWFRSGSNSIPKEEIKRKQSASGTSISYGSILGYEKNVKFGSPGSFAAFARQMKREDARTAALDMIVRHMIKGPTWEAKASSTRKNAKRNADFINEAFGWNNYSTRMDRTWEEILEGISNFAGYGYWVTEEVYKYEDGQFWLRDLCDIEPESIKGWMTAPSGELDYITQYPYSQGEPTPQALSAYKTLVFTNQKTGRNFEGVGLLRPCVVWYELKKILTNMIGIGAQKWGMPVPKVSIDRGAIAASQYQDDEINSMITRANEIAKSYQAGQASYVSDTPITKLETFGENKFDALSNLLLAIQHCNKEMASAYMNLWIDLGISGEGNRSLGETSHDASRVLYDDLLDKIKTVLGGKSRPGGGVVDRLLKLNFYGDMEIPEDEFPIIEHSGIKTDAFKDIIPMLPGLISSGAITVDRTLEDAIRSLINIPRREDAIIEQKVDAATQVEGVPI